MKCIAIVKEHNQLFFNNHFIFTYFAIIGILLKVFGRIYFRKWYRLTFFGEFYFLGKSKKLRNSRKLSKNRDLLHTYLHCVKSFPIGRFFGPYSVQIGEYMDQKISKYRHFSHNGNLIKTLWSGVKNFELILFFVIALKRNELENWFDNNF